MFGQFINRLIQFFFSSHKRPWLIQLLIFGVIVFPFLITSYFKYIETRRDITELTLSRRQSLANLAAVVLKEKLDRIIDVGISFATRVQFRKFIEEGKWDEAVKILERAPKDFPYIDNAALFDPQGTIWAVTPPIPEVIGQNFAYRDYYKGVSKNWQPYISEVFKRAVEPKYNIISVAIPIRSDAVRETDRKIIGILLLTIKLDTILEWARQIDIGTEGFVYFVDTKGHIAGHPKLSSSGEVVDFSEVPAVKKVIQGERGVEVTYNQVEKEERISAYEPVLGYGWGVIAQQPTITAFASRDEHLRRVLTVDLTITAILIFLAYLILNFIKSLDLYRQKERVMLESIGDGLVAIDRYWNVTSWNKAAAGLTGWSIEEAVGKPLRDLLKLISEKDRKENIRFIEETMLFGKIHFMENNTLLIRKDGSELYVEDSASPIFNAKGQVNGAIVIFRDVSKERELEKAREEFNSLASHQLRAPVTVIKGYTELLLDGSVGVINPEQKKYLEEMSHASKNMVGLVNALLNVSKIETGIIAVNPESAYLPDIADDVLRELMPQIQKKNIILKKTYDKGLPAINVDVKLVQVIFNNLISNAVKYTPEKGGITVEIAKKDNEIIIKVADTGYGIPKSEQPKVFSKFFRASNISEKIPEGTGLGLYMVKSIVDQSGGKIWFESEENIGTTFYVAIPLDGMKKKEGLKGLN